MDANNVEVRELAVSHPAVQLDYVTTEPSTDALSAEVGTISGGYYNGLKHGWSVSRLTATVVDVDSRPIARWYAKADWYADYRRGELTARELSLKALETLTRL